MAKLNKHGLKITGVKEFVSACKKYLPCENFKAFGSYNTLTGEVEFNSGFYNDTIVYNNDKMINFANYRKPPTMQEVCDDISEAVKFWGSY